MSLKLKITFDENRMGQVDQIDAQDSENSCDDENDEENVQTFDTMTSLKRKRSYRQSDIVYTSQKIFDNHQEATQYVDSMGIWKFERNRPTKKGSKGFYHCKMSDECKAKIYLLMDPQSSFVVLYQNNVDHDHSFYSQLKKKQIESALAETKSEIDKEESMPVEIVNDDDFEDSLVDLFDESNENKTNVNETNQSNNYFESTNGLNNTLNRIELTYTPDKYFETRIQANQYLDAVYPGMWKFERTRPTKMGSKCFYKCRISENCKAKIFILAQQDRERVVIFKNNIEHSHTSLPQSSIKKAINGCFGMFNAKTSNGMKVENHTGNSTNLNSPIDNDNSNDSFDEDNDESSKAGLLANRFELIYTAEESFENRQLANQFIDSLNIWKFQRTRPTKKGNKCFYACKLNRDCKSKIYVLSTPESENVTIFRNNHIHDHTQTRNRNSSMININKINSNHQNGAFNFESNIDKLNETVTERYENEVGTFSNNDNVIRNNIGMRFDFNYSPEQSFPNRSIASKYIESLGTWKFERTRSTKKGSKGFYHCKVADSCKSKIYLLTEPHTEQVTLYRNNVNHNHTNIPRNVSAQYLSNNIMHSLNYVDDDNKNNEQNLDGDNFDENQMDEYGSLSDNINSVENRLRINMDENQNDSEDMFTNIKNEEDDLHFYENNVNEEENKNHDEEFLEDNKCFQNTDVFSENRSDANENGFLEENSENSLQYNHVSNHDQNDYEEQEEDEENYDSYDNLASIPEGNCFSEESSNKCFGEENNNKACFRENPIYIAEKSFENKKIANQYIESLNVWKFDRLRDSKTGIKGFYQCKVSDFCKAKIYLLFHPDSEKVTLYKNNLQHEHSIKKIKKWGLTSLTKKLIDEAYLSGNTKPMSCLYKVRSLINAKAEKLKIGKLNRIDVTDLQNELDQLEIPPMTVLKNYINNTLKPKLNGQKECLSSEESGNNDFHQICDLSKRILFLEQINKKLEDELEKERETNKEISKQLESANNALKNSKLPKDCLVNLSESNEFHLKEQQNNIAALQKKIEELTACLEKEKNISIPEINKN